MNAVNENQLLTLVAHSDQVAFRSLFDRFYPQVYGFLVKFLHTEADASDVAQEVFIKIWTMRDILTEIHNISGYMYRMTVNTAINFAKGNRRYCEELSLDLPYDQVIEDLIDSKEKQKRIASLVKSMPEQRRRIFIMSRFEMIPNARIAAVLGISKKTVENHINLALKELRLAGLN